MDDEDGEEVFPAAAAAVEMEAIRLSIGFPEMVELRSDPSLEC